MTLDLLRTLLFFITGGFLIFLAITIARDNFSNRLNRVTGAMILFAGLGPVFMALGGIIDPQSALAAGDESPVYNLHYIWEMFFPVLLLFSWIFPQDRLKTFSHPRLRYLIFFPQIMHLVVVLFFVGVIGFLDVLKPDAGAEGFSAYLTRPISSLTSWLQLFLGFIHTYHLKIFGIINLLYIFFSVYFIESGRRYLDNPRIITQTNTIAWALRTGLALYVISFVGRVFFPDIVSEAIQSVLLLLALLISSALLILATIRYQFLDVRVFFRQSFVYSITSAVLVGLYILLVVQSQTFLLPLFGNQTEIVSYIFIIFILLLFQPINNWIDEFTRSLFMRTRTDHRNVIERFSRQVISLFDPVKLRQIIEETLKTTLLVERVTFVMFDDRVEEYVMPATEDNQKRMVLDREDLMLRGINLLDSPAFYHTLGDFKTDSKLSAHLDEFNAKLIVPMKDSEHLLGFIALSDKSAGYTYSSEDLNLLGVLSNQMVTALTNARLYVDSLERIRLQEEVNMARQIQLDLLPANPPVHESFIISAHSTPSRTVGGDFFDFIVKDKKVGICIADASGKGMPAALMIAQTQAILKSEVNNGNPIDTVLCNMNQQLVLSSSSEKYVTLFYGELDTESGRFDYSNAGHNYPVLVRSSGEFELLKDGGPIVGALPMLSYSGNSVKLETGDLLFFFTDGLSEAMDESDVEYSEERIHKFIVDNRTSEPDEIIDAIIKDVRAFDPSYPPRDDTTIVALKVNNGFSSNER